MSFLTRFAACALAAWLVQSPAFSQTVLEIPEAKRLAYGLIDQGNADAARQILKQLHERNPNDFEVLLGLSRAERAVGNHTAAVEAGKSAFRSASDNGQKFQSARAVAQALSSAGKRTRAQLWLRRAGALAPTPNAEAIVRSEYRYVRARNPLSFSLGATISPSDNVNDAPLTNTLEIGPFVAINPAAVPISGLESTISAAATLRLPSTERAINSVTLSYFGKRVALGDDAETVDPTLEDKDFAFDRIGLEWSGRFRNPEQNGLWDVSVLVFADQSGGSRFQEGQRLKFGHTFRAAQNQTLRFGVDLTSQDRHDLVSRSSDIVTLEAQWSFLFENLNRLSLRAAVSDVHSESASLAHSANSVGATYAFGKPLLAAYWAVGLDIRNATYDRTSFSFLDRREDTQVLLSTSATFTELDVYGFAPVVEFRYERNHSNISSFDRRSTQIGVSLRSTY